MSIADTASQPPTAEEFLNPRTAIYRHFDWNGELLYVGITSDPARRWHQHREMSMWARFVEHTVVEWLDNRKAARKAERRAIEWERPLFNRARPGGADQGLEHQLAYLRTGISGLPRRVRCEVTLGTFCISCGPDRDAWLDASYTREMGMSA